MKYSLLMLSFISFSLQAQCYKKDPKVLEVLQRLQKNNSDEMAVASDYQCKDYYINLCESKKDFFMVKDKKILRTKQMSFMIEDRINEIVDNYNKIGRNTCGELKKVKAKYGEEIKERKENIVGYWIAEEETYGKKHYLEFFFGNNNNFNNSGYNSALEKGSWKKIDTYTYEIKHSYFDTFEKKQTAPTVNTFIIDPKTNTAKYYWNNGIRSGVGNFYFKGVAYHLYGLSDTDKLKTKNISMKIDN
jgi:hypothetical protein